jgi:hypothetical protein
MSPPAEIWPRPEIVESIRTLLEAAHFCMHDDKTAAEYATWLRWESRTPIDESLIPK